MDIRKRRRDKGEIWRVGSKRRGRGVQEWRGGHVCPLSLVPTEKKAPAYEASALNYLVRAKNFKSDRVRPTNRPVP